MATIVIEVMPKKELLDPAGKAVLGALHRQEVAGLSRGSHR
jgi:phosphoribosylformylglycinamidine (FGAM) synthase PurS component